MTKVHHIKPHVVGSSADQSSQQSFGSQDIFQNLDKVLNQKYGGQLTPKQKRQQKHVQRLLKVILGAGGLIMKAADHKAKKAERPKKTAKIKQFFKRFTSNNKNK